MRYLDSRSEIIIVCLVLALYLRDLEEALSLDTLQSQLDLNFPSFRGCLTVCSSSFSAFVPCNVFVSG